MPFIGRDAAILCMLMCCVPLQYWLSQRSYVSPDHRKAEVYKLVEEVQDVIQRWCSVKGWLEWLLSVRKRYIKTGEFLVEQNISVT